MTKRSFYEDDEYIINKPGTTVAITSQLEEKESTHGNATFVDGMVIRSTPIIEKYANSIRHYFHDKLSLWGAELDTQKSAASNEIKNLKYEIDSLIQEPVLPNLIYILTIGLTGSILARRRNILVRFTTPVVFSGTGLWYFMPKTFNAIGVKYDQLEQEYLPDVHMQRQELKKNLVVFGKKVDEGVAKTNESVLQAVHDFRKTVKEIWE